MPEAPLPLQYRAMVHDRKGATMTTRTSTMVVLASLSQTDGAWRRPFTRLSRCRSSG
jgi:hypothetical protein